MAVEGGLGETRHEVGSWGRLETCGGLATRQFAPVSNRRAAFPAAPIRPTGAASANMGVCRAEPRQRHTAGSARAFTWLRFASTDTQRSTRHPPEVFWATAG